MTVKVQEFAALKEPITNKVKTLRKKNKWYLGDTCPHTGNTALVKNWVLHHFAFCHPALKKVRRIVSPNSDLMAREGHAAACEALHIFTLLLL